MYVYIYVFCFSYGLFDPAQMPSPAINCLQSPGVEQLTVQRNGKWDQAGLISHPGRLLLGWRGISFQFRCAKPSLSCYCRACHLQGMSDLWLKRPQNGSQAGPISPTGLRATQKQTTPNSTRKADLPKL